VNYDLILVFLDVVGALEAGLWQLAEENEGGVEKLTKHILIYHM